MGYGSNSRFRRRNNMCVASFIFLTFAKLFVRIKVHLLLEYLAGNS